LKTALFLMVNGRSDAARLLKHMAAKGKPEKRRKAAKEQAKKSARNWQRNRHSICMNKGE
jgi:hypothetical protein